MRKTALIAALALLSVVACDSVLDIEDPTMRPRDAGEAGEASGQPNGGAAGGTTPAEPGAAGEHTASPMIVGGGETGGGAGEGGEAGQPTMKDCAPGEPRCTDKVPEVCDASGHWVQNSEETSGECAQLCAAGKCVACEEGEKRCAICDESDNNCSPRLPQTCVDGAWQDDDAPCEHFCNAGNGACVTPPSCNTANADGTTCQDGVSCCSSLLVPGGSFFRDYDGSDDHEAKVWPADISAFYLDKFEVTVGRMRSFLAAYDQLNLTDGSGKSTHISDDPGWSTAYALPNKADLLTALNSCSGTTWSDTAISDDDHLPVNCVSFNVAYAFCIWDGGRLPTEVEWNFAAAGGTEQRVYPWKMPLSEPSIAPQFANYGDANPGPVVVGSTPAGDGRWGQSDLAGNVAEWTLDYRGDRPAKCNDCLDATAAQERTQRGGSYRHDPDYLQVSFRNSDLPDAIRSPNGFRCARDLN